MTMKWTCVMMILCCHSLADAGPAADPLDSYKAGKLEKLTVTPESRMKDVIRMDSHNP